MLLQQNNLICKTMITYLFKFKSLLKSPLLVLELILRKYFNQVNHHGAKSFSFQFLYLRRKPMLACCVCVALLGDFFLPLSLLFHEIKLLTSETLPY